MYKKLNFTLGVKTIAFAVNEINNVTRGGLDLYPVYKKGNINTDDFDKIINSIICGYPIGSMSILTLREFNIRRAKSEVIDGQKRLIAIYEFVTGQYEIGSCYAHKITLDILKFFSYTDYEDEKLQHLNALLNSGEKFTLTFSMLPQVIKESFLNYNLAVNSIFNVTNEQISDYLYTIQSI